MSTGLVLGARADRIDQALFAMRSRGVRRLPVVDEAGQLVGMVSLDDLLVLLSAELGQTAAVARANEGPLGAKPSAPLSSSTSLVTMVMSKLPLRPRSTPWLPGPPF